MIVTEITVTVGATESLGNYSNVRPEVRMTAKLSEMDSTAAAIDRLLGMATEQIHSRIDDELESAGLNPRHYKGTLYCVYYSKVRRCIIIAPAGMTLPQEENWKHRDRWMSADGYPRQMRPGTVGSAADALQRQYPDYVRIDIDAPDAIHVLPPLPDPGPEPAWKAKRLDNLLDRLGIPSPPSEYWGELASLEHVTADYLERLYRMDLDRASFETRLAVIRENRPWPPVVAEPQADDWADEDEDEDWDGDDE